MDLILLQPGTEYFFGGFQNEPTTYDVTAPDDVPGFDFNSCIPLISVQHGLQQQLTSGADSAGRTSGRPFTDLSCVKYTDKTSVRFFDYCMRAVPLGEGKEQPTYIHIFSTTADKHTSILSFALRDALIGDIQFQTNPNDMPTEQFKLNFTEVLWTYRLRNPAAAPLGRIFAGWSSITNSPIAEFTT